MRASYVKNGLIMVVILLFVGVTVQPSIATIQPENKINIEPKDYLFKTIIEIANNPDVKDYIKQINFDWIDVDIKNIISRLLKSNPKILFNMLFTKSSLTYDYLDNCYNYGVELADTLNEAELIEIMEFVNINNQNIFNDLNNIILNYEVLSNRILKIEEINMEIKSNLFSDNSLGIICLILGLMVIPVILSCIPGILIAIPLFAINLIVSPLFSKIVTIIALPLSIYLFGTLLTIWSIGIDLGCWETSPPY